MILILLVALIFPSYTFGQSEIEIEGIAPLDTWENQDSTTTNSDTLITSKQPPYFQRVYHIAWNNLQYTWELRSKMAAAPGYIGKEVQDFFKPHGNDFGWFPLFELHPTPDLKLARHFTTEREFFPVQSGVLWQLLKSSILY